MKALLVGAGGMGQTWARNILDHAEVELDAWVDIRPGATKEAADKLGFSLPYGGEDVEAAIVDRKPSFVVDVTIPEAHHDVTLTALRYGIPVLGEKPMAASMEQARSMVAASERAGVLYMVSQSRRYDPGIQAFKGLLNGLGSIGILNADFYIGAHFGGFRDDMPSPLILDMAIHTFDEARYLTGKAPVAVYAEEFNPSWSWYQGDACAQALFEMEDGLRFNYRGSWCAEGAHTSWDGDWRAVGERGTAIWDHNQTPYSDIVSKSGGFHSETVRTTGDVKNIRAGIAGSLDEFVHALRTGATPNGECHDNIKSLAMVFAVLESSRSGRRVRIDEI